MDALEYLRQRNTHEVKLETGLVVTIELQQLAELLISGDAPLPILAKMQTGEATDTDVTAADLRAARDFNVRAAAGCIRKVADYDVPAEEREAVVLALADEEFNELVAYATRQKDPESGEA